MGTDSAPADAGGGGMVSLLHGDALEELRKMDTESVDAIVTDPPYGWRFMGKKLDYSIPSVDVFAECLRVLKPGGHALVACGTRTQHRMACNIEDGGFKIRDVILWLYGSGFPKSLNVSRAIERMEISAIERMEISAIERKFCEWVRDHSGLTPADIGTDRFHAQRIEIVNTATTENPRYGRRSLVPTAANFERIKRKLKIPAPSWVIELVKNPPMPPIEHPGQWKKGKGEGTAGDNDWQGWGTALKPACEMWTLARKPLVGTVAANVQQYGTGALNIDGCRIGTEPSNNYPKRRNAKIFTTGSGGQDVDPPTQGRWPANVIHDGSEEVMGLFPETSSGFMKAGTRRNVDGGYHGNFPEEACNKDTFADKGSAARFFYTAKASASERNSHSQNRHPTVKPVDLMRYLCRLITPLNGIVLDPFMGSGSTGVAAKREGFSFIGVDMDAHWVEVARRRIGCTAHQKKLFSEVIE